MKRIFFSLALLLAVTTLIAQTNMTAREAAVKIADRILASTTYELALYEWCNQYGSHGTGG